MTLSAVIPLRGFASGKSRLGPILDEKNREALNRRLFSQIAAYAIEVLSSDRVFVASPDEAVIAEAEALGLTALRDPPKADLNGVLTQAQRAAEQQGATALLSLSCDLPLLRAQDIDAVCRTWRGVDYMVIAPDDAGTGTNALIIPVGSGFTYHMGAGSAGRHRDEAALHGLTLIEFNRAGTAFDLDTPTDLERLYSLEAAQNL